jgi:hypothetical protein
VRRVTDRVTERDADRSGRTWSSIIQSLTAKRLAETESGTPWCGVSRSTFVNRQRDNRSSRTRRNTRALAGERSG